MLLKTKVVFQKHQAKYKLLLISAGLNSFAQSEMESAYTSYQTTFLYKKKKGNIEVYVMTWSELIKIQRNKLTFLSKHLKIKDKSVRLKFEEEYPHLINHKMRTILKKVS